MLKILSFCMTPIQMAAKKALIYVKNFTDFLKFCYLNYLSQNTIILSMRMSFSSDEMTQEDCKADVSVLHHPDLCPQKGCSLGIGDRRSLCLLLGILRLMCDSL